MEQSGVERISPKYVLRSHLDSLRRIHGDRWQQTPERARVSREILNGDRHAPIPEAFTRIGLDVDAFRVDLPHKYLVPYHQRNVLSKQPPRLKRWSRGDSIDAKTESTRIEQIMQAVMDECYDFRASADIGLNEAVALSITLPETASMARAPSLYDPDGTTIKARYQRDAAGKTRDEAGKGFRLSKKRSADAHKRDLREVLSRQIPLSIELLGPTAFIPVFGPGLVLDAVLVERWWTITEVLRRRWIWSGMDDHLSPDGSAVQGFETSSRTHASTGQIKVTELYAVDWQDDGYHPYVAYLVDGKRTFKRNEDGSMADAVLDLREEFGMERLPCVLKWFSHWAHPEYDKRAMPFILPLAQSYLAVDAILTGAVVHNWWRGFPTLIEQPSPNSPPDYGTTSESPEDEALEIAPLSIIRTKGQITELGTKGVSPDTYRLVEVMLGANKEEGPPPAAFGGGGESGFQASLAKAYADDAQDDVRDALLDLFKETASVALEALCGIAERYGPVPIQRITPVPLGKRSGERKRDILDLTYDLAGGLYDLDAEWPPVPNLAKGQQYAEWASLPNPLILEDEFREEIIGDQNPEIYQARKLAQMIRSTPEWQAKVMALAAQLAGDEDEEQQLNALAEQSALQNAEGQNVPASLAVGLDQAQASVPLTGAGGPPSVGQSALGGAIGGPMAAVQQAAAAGGAVPPNIPLGAV